MDVRWRMPSTRPASHASERDAQSAVIELADTGKGAGAAVAVGRSGASSSTKGWCKGYKAYMQLSQLCVAASLPLLLCVSAGGGDCTAPQQ